ncbi:MAG: hypothetical protein MZW92_48865 [Comamonadaceae bacterium]|nr:hypothetical protein [Comamonadaceae bacterium]
MRAGRARAGPAAGAGRHARRAHADAGAEGSARSSASCPTRCRRSGEGAWAPFFGRPAYTMTLPARLAAAVRRAASCSSTASGCRRARLPAAPGAARRAADRRPAARRRAA